MRYFVLVALVSVGVAAPAMADHGLALHWKKRDAGRISVFLVDQTQGRFPVRDAVHRWNGTGAIHVVMTDQCPASRGCIVVQPRAMRYLGLTTLHNDGEHITRAVASLSTTRSMSPAKRASITCHELGHALGLGHRQVTSSCLFNGNQFPGRPDRHDLDQLRTQYAHQH